MRALLLVLLFATTVHAQAPTDTPPARPTGAQRTGMAAAGVGAGVVALFASAATPIPDVGIVVALGAMPLATAAGVHVVGRMAGLDQPFRATLTDAAIGGLIAIPATFVVGYATYQTVRLADPSSDEGFIPATVVFSVLAGVATYVVVPAVVAARRYGPADVTVAPAALAVPGGASAPGVTLRVGL